MDPIKGRNVALAVALAFAVSPAFAHGGRNAATSNGSDVSTSDNGVVTTVPNATPSSNPATAWDTGKTSPYSGALGQESTPTTSDEDHNDEGAYPPAPPRADTSNVPAPSNDSRASTGADAHPSSHPGSEENLDGSRNGQG